jgi:hypothetical protein
MNVMSQTNVMRNMMKIKSVKRLIMMRNVSETMSMVILFLISVLYVLMKDHLWNFVILMNLWILLNNRIIRNLLFNIVPNCPFEAVKTRRFWWQLKTNSAIMGY